ncbi:hypothetical protein KFK09_027341 [Dendrobium nobile]|uniref:BED-type domain-containing protein n=1 Tax=Dendrobium nobile TaxID=94219 RepID=A0A8T3AFN2_DENNO|nr:hypothetical protein KFK09_027341 [Dendrobium nobile]
MFKKTYLHSCFYKKIYKCISNIYILLVFNSHVIMIFFRMSTPISMEWDNIEPANIETERHDDHLHSYVGSQPLNENNTQNADNEIDEEVEKWTNENQVDDIEEVEDAIGRNKRKKRSKVWDEFKEIILPTGQKKGECVHCKKQLLIGVTGATTQFKRHLDRCAVKIRAIKKQKILHIQPSDIVKVVLEINFFIIYLYHLHYIFISS